MNRRCNLKREDALFLNASSAASFILHMKCNPVQGGCISTRPMPISWRCKQFRICVSVPHRIASHSSHSRRSDPIKNNQKSNKIQKKKKIRKNGINWKKKKKKKISNSNQWCAFQKLYWYSQGEQLKNGKRREKSERKPVSKFLPALVVYDLCFGINHEI